MYFVMQSVIHKQVNIHTITVKATKFQIEKQILKIYVKKYENNFICQK